MKHPFFRFSTFNPSGRLQILYSLISTATFSSQQSHLSLIPTLKKPTLQKQDNMETSSVFRWRSLAREIQLMILKLAVVPDDGASVTHLAAVCQDWQAIVERTTFSRLTITPDRLGDFSNILRTHRRRECVRYIWLRIELPGYDCSESNTAETEDCDLQNNEIICHTISGMLKALSAWRGSGRGGLQLDISTHSPSDNQHRFKEIRFLPDTIPEQHLVDDKTTDVSHDCVDTTRPARLPPTEAIKRLFSHSWLDSFLWESLPGIPAVTAISFRRQTRRRWEPEGLGQLLKVLPQLKEISYEPWREWDDGLQKHHNDEASIKLFDSLNTDSLDKMVLFEDSNDDFIRSFRRRPNQNELHHTQRVRTSPPELNKSLAKASLNLVQFSASFIADAYHFFQVCQPDWVWERLTSISLTSRALSRNSNEPTINGLIERAAGVAARMPALNTLEIWNANTIEPWTKKTTGQRNTGMATVFRYQYREHGEGRLPAVITWRGTFGVHLKEHVIQAWKDVAFQRRGQRDGVFRFVMELIPNGERRKMKSVGDAVRLLQLVNEVARPVSLWQIREGM